MMAESIVFNCQALDEEEVEDRSEPWAVESENARLRSELARLRTELKDCQAGHCVAAYEQNSQGGEARRVVGLIARAAGVNLGASHEGPRPLDGDVFSPRNMMRVVQAVQELAGEHKALRKELHDRDKKDDRTVAALREALIHAGEAV
ncbi:hypothetical protein PBI_PAEDORE_58 [Streptomyces phage Paedore]|uniref:Uncharacterized protein n=1 Tax=Streptomyces phage Paedore TaxID=2108134 RepID=A0A2P1JTR7_9CAUD|nr:hypothetical protein KGG91_gp58 [Streptomyces phage Paedore]AVO22541.1 hypothetical protein PBI_PAEDORE_58 [Streptomyces phage Paedore]